MDDERGGDVLMMHRAIELGARGRRSAPPNPWVGCVVVRDGEIAGQGYHREPGSPHAEVHALAGAGTRARGATVYVTLEPCAHHGRTPPCVEALLAAGVRRVVVGVEDPDPRVAGRGLAALRAAGVEVQVGVAAAAVRSSLEPYLHHRSTGRPYVLAKAATSLDGRTAAADGSSRWVTGEQARADAHGLRADSQAVAVGAGTAEADRPALTARLPGVSRQPLRVVLDARGRVDAAGPLFDVSLAPTLVVTTSHAAPGAVRAWKAAGAEVEEVAPAPGGVDLAEALALLGRRGVVQVLVEGGSTLHGALLLAGLVDRLVVYVGAAVLGDGGRPLFAGVEVATVADAPRPRLLGVQRFGDDVRIDYGFSGAA